MYDVYKEKFDRHQENNFRSPFNVPTEEVPVKDIKVCLTLWNIRVLTLTDDDSTGTKQADLFFESNPDILISPPIRVRGCPLRVPSAGGAQLPGTV